ncbi:hypothetical protein FOH10_06660 [Nocardia otitidiscaviarum]|uniref:5,10-methylene-tetrahydrofolate dehydrogenase n=1 Tax=Nocardia otitidiscaviarum TaxID=1823 RepID=A0A516NHX4_9NOCA|nr:hypothetical protein [Nocardia otitidiscaviarum]MCP9618677.1 hypothetical protein [Nocardia otitidiscaviarum]QDP78469.1 hypothetical protein FOH10_06660 [Nocardia otitidiscaviarum]
MVDSARENRMVIGLLADPDLPSQLARRLGDELPGELGRALGGGTEWRAEVLADPFEALYPDHEYLIDKAHERVRDTPWDIALCITDVPLHDGGGVVVANIDAPGRVAVVSLPALGGVRLRRRLTELAVALVGALLRRPEDTAVDRELARRLPSPLRVHRGPADTDTSVVRSRRSGVPTLLAGMVRANRPWQLIVGLSTALAGALTGTAFGVLYSSIWTLAVSLSGLRLAGITVAALASLTLWIIVGHGLWDTRESFGWTQDSDRLLRNAGTVATVAVGTTAFFGTLYLLALAAVTLVIPPEYLSGVVQRPVRIHDYLAIALVATVLGTIAGAVGSGLEDDVTVRKATYSYRERERRRRAEQRRHRDQ